MILAVANQAQIRHDRNNDGNQIDSVKGVASVHDPSVDDGGQRQKEEPKSEEQQRVVRALEEVGQKEQNDDCEARERQCQQQYQAGHMNAPAWEMLGNPGCFSPLKPVARFFIGRAVWNGDLGGA
jgi:copper chaperone CopZ